MRTRAKRKISLDKNRYGYIFVAPFVIGFILFILIPVVQSLIFSFNEIRLVKYGYTLEPQGLLFYKRALLIDANVRKLIVQALAGLTDLPVILVFSFFAALLLNNRFKGRNAAKAIFFLPVIVSTGLIVVLDNSNSSLNMMMSRNTLEAADSVAVSLTATRIVEFFFTASMPQWVVQFIGGAIDRIYDIIIASGLQIIIFLSGLNTIPPSIYESSNIEGATAWENFWKITLPMMGPYILVNTMYTIIDSFTNLSNPVISTIRAYFASFSEFSFASAIAWIYFGVIFLILAIIYPLLSRRVFYYE